MLKYWLYQRFANPEWGSAASGHLRNTHYKPPKVSLVGTAAHLTA